VIANRKKHQLEQIVTEQVEVGSALYTDQLRSYDRMATRGYIHSVIDHAEAYADGQVHTNGLENFWSLLKRAIRHLRIGRAVPSIPLSGRTSVSLQQSQGI
jgi:transposase-like protein